MILSACGDEVQPSFRSFAGSAGAGGCPCLPGSSGVAGPFLAGIEPDGLCVALLFRRDAGSEGDPGADRLSPDATQAAGDSERRRGRALSGSGAVAQGAHRTDYSLCRRLARLGGGEPQGCGYRQRPDGDPGPPRQGRHDRTVMLSPQPLGILRTYWRLARPEDWLFPGRGASRSMCKSCTRPAVQPPRRRAWSSG